MRAPLAIAALCLLSPSLGLADEFSGAWPATPGREFAELQRWAAQRRAEDSVRLENQKRDAERAFDRSQEEIRLRRIEQRLDQLEQSRSTR
ncbi:MAG TPA: hypothetical protein VKM54_06265 [Myxococcota bacterium]|nr:hypothetical protein [Myxococcota bacterium]